MFFALPTRTGCPVWVCCISPQPVAFICLDPHLLPGPHHASVRLHLPRWPLHPVTSEGRGAARMDPTLSNAADIVDLVYATVWTVIFTLAALLVLSYLVGEAIRSACRPAKAGSLLLILFAAVVRAVVPLRPTTIPDIVATNVFYSLYPLFFSQISLLIVVWMDWLLYFQTSPAVGRQRTVFWRRIGLIAVILAYFAAACVLGQYSLASDIPVVDVKFIYYSLGLSVFLLPLYMNYGLKVRRALRKALAAGNPHPYGKANLEHDICKLTILIWLPCLSVLAGLALKMIDLGVIQDSDIVGSTIGRIAWRLVEFLYIVITSATLVDREVYLAPAEQTRDCSPLFLDPEWKSAFPHTTELVEPAGVRAAVASAANSPHGSNNAILAGIYRYTAFLRLTPSPSPSGNLGATSHPSTPTLPEGAGENDDDSQSSHHYSTAYGANVEKEDLCKPTLVLEPKSKVALR